jgi:very-short-patch-repair endonuclease
VEDAIGQDAEVDAAAAALGRAQAGARDVVDVVGRLGGIARRREVLEQVPRGALEAAVRDGRLVRPARGRYALPTGQHAQQAAHRLTGTAMLLSAAAHWQWATKTVPPRPQVAVPRGRKVPDSARRSVDVRWRTVAPRDRVDGWVTDPLTTVVDCATLLPFDEALAVVDSALRSGGVRYDALLRRRDLVPVQHRPRVRRVVASASSLAANPFESVLRAIALDVPGLTVRPQVEIHDRHGRIGRVDLADLDRRIVIEADSHEFHTGAEAFSADCRRYDRLVVAGWLVLRFTWWQVMRAASWVSSVLAEAVALRSAA